MVHVGIVLADGHWPGAPWKAGIFCQKWFNMELVVKARSYFEPSFIGPRTSAKRTQAPNIPMYRYQKIDGLSRVSFAMHPPQVVSRSW